MTTETEKPAASVAERAPEPWEVREAKEDETLVPSIRSAVDFLRTRGAAQPSALERLLLSSPDAVPKYLERRNEAFLTLRRFAVKMTHPQDWVRFRGRDGSESVLLCGPGADKVAETYGISYGNHRDGAGRAITEPALTREEDGSWTAEIVGDAYCHLTGRYIEGVIGRRNSAEDFTGRKGNAVVGRNDLQSAAFTAYRAKAVRMLTGLRGLPTSFLTECGFNIEACRKGAGFGTSAERAAARAPAPAPGPPPGKPSDPTPFDATPVPEAPAPEEPPEGSPASTPPPARTFSGPVISEPQRKRLWAIAYKRVGGDKLAATRLVRSIIAKLGIERTEDIPRDYYEGVVRDVESQPVPGA